MREMLARIVFGLSLFMLSIVTLATAGPVIDGRLAYLSATKDDRMELFAGSLRFVQKPSEEQMQTVTDLGVQFYDHGNGPVGSRTIYPAKIPFAAIARLETLDFLVAVDCAWRPATPPPVTPVAPLARSGPEVEADQAWQLTAPNGGGLSGAGVTICDIDTGINYLNAAFFKRTDERFDWLDLDASGDLSLGDMVDLNGNGQPNLGEHLDYRENEGTNQYGNDPGQYDTDFDWLYNDANSNGSRQYGPPDYTEADPCYGERIFLTDDVNENGRLDPGEQLVALGESKVRAILNKDGTVYRRGIDLLDSEADAWGHGTRVCGIAFGGWGDQHRMSGMAPGAESLHVNYQYIDEPPFLVPIEAGLAWAVAEGADIVLIEDGEWVWEYMDGSSNVEIMINEFAEDDDVIFVIPAGNLANGDMHTHFSSAGGEILQVYMNHRVVWPAFLWRDDVDLTLILTPPDGTPIVIPADGSTIIEQGYRIYSNFSISPRGTRRLDLRLSSDPVDLAIVGDWAFDFVGPDTDLHGYFVDNHFSWFSNSRWLVGLDESHTVTWPATADSAISVTAYSVDDEGDIDTYSGWGPRIDGRPDVDLAAPGRTVYSPSPVSDGDYLPFNGTSGAAPHVAGAAALMRELVPDLDSGQCRYYLRAGAGQDEFTDDIHRWGAGKLRIYSAISELLAGLSVTPRYPEFKMAAYPNPFNPSCMIRFLLAPDSPAKLRIFSVDGRLVWSRDLSAGVTGLGSTNSDLDTTGSLHWREIAWHGIDEHGRRQASGVYFAHVVQQHRHATCKLMLVK